MKRLMTLALGSFCMTLSAITVGNVDIQFPPSKTEWKLMGQVDQDSPAFSFDDEDEDFDEELISSRKFQAAVYTHREGDKLELFSVLSVENDSEDELDEEFLNQLFDPQSNGPSMITIHEVGLTHKIVSNTIASNEKQKLIEWEINDGEEVLIHGYAKIVKVGQNEFLVMNYISSGMKTEMERALWLMALNQAQILN